MIIIKGVINQRYTYPDQMNLIYKLPSNKDRLILSTAFTLLLIITTIITIQKYFQYGGYLEYNLVNSIFFNSLAIMTFIIPVYFIIRYFDKVEAIISRKYSLYSILLGVTILSVYIIIVNSILYLLNLSSSFVTYSFVAKYLTGTIQVHLIILYFIFFIKVLLEKKKKERSIPLKHLNETHWIKISAIDLVESYGHYIKVYLGDGFYLKRTTMEKILIQLGDEFIRVHRKYIIKRNCLDQSFKKQGRWYILIGDKTIRVSKTYEKELEHRT